MRQVRVTLLILVAALLACTDSGVPTTTGTFVVGVLPDRSRDALLAQYTPLIAYLENASGADLELVVHESYEELLSAFVQREVHLAWFGGLTFVKAAAAAGARPLVMRDADLRFKSYYLVAADSPWRSIDDLRGASFSFGSRLSTSGHLMPRHFLQVQGIVPEEFFGSVGYSGAHDATAELVRSGAVDAGVANRVVIDAMFSAGELGHDELRILTTTPPFHDYVWALQPDVDEATRTALLDAFLALDINDPSHALILRAQGAESYMPASPSDFDAIRAVAHSSGLLGRETGS